MSDHFDIAEEKAGLGLLDLIANPEPAEEDTWMRVLAPFNECMIGMIRFQGETPWEIHPDDELLHILEGSVDVTILAPEGEHKATLSAGQICIVPRKCWHKQNAKSPVSLMYVTSRDHNGHSEAADPRNAAA